LRDTRERNATKADNAAVPEYLWEEHLLEGVSEQEWDATKLVKIRKLSSWLRSNMLNRWKRNVTASYINWVKEKYELDDVKTKIDWVSRNGSR
jgi:hypothetical protein